MTFQVVIPNQLGQGAIGAALSTFYTVPALTRTFVKDMDIANDTKAPITVAVYLVKPAGVAGDGTNTLLPHVVVPPNSVLQWTGLQILPAGATIQAIASIVGCTITISGGEAT